MSEFQSDIDIANRACQHCGVRRIDASEGFDEDYKAASEIGSVYGKLRQAELQRNLWTFAMKRAVLRAIDTDTMVLSPALWVADTTYFVGSVVADSSGNLWESVIPNNLGNSPTATTAWKPYFGPMTAEPYDSGTAYYAGELVYTAAGDGTNRVYKSLVSGNDEDPETAASWDSTATYRKNQVVTRTAVDYMSLIDLNTGNDPALAPAAWASGTTYGAGDEVAGSDGLIYTSVGNGNVANDPTVDTGINWTNTNVLVPWTTDFVGGNTSLQWLQIGGEEFPSGVTLTTPNLIYPLGAGPVSQNGTRNAFKLPANFLRRAPQDPKAGMYGALGASANHSLEDWLFDDGYLVSSDSGPIVLRFVADITDVRLMHPMFCEGLGARIGFEVCEALTQSTQKKSTIAQTYQKFMSEARLVDAIEQGQVEPPEDEFIVVRM